jgi:large repetitive protein
VLTGPAFQGLNSSPVPAAANLAGGATGTAYSETISAQGGSGGYSFAVHSGSLPTSLSLNTSTGVISGTPTVASTYTFTIRVTDSHGAFGDQAFSIVIAAPASSGNYGWITRRAKWQRPRQRSR